MKPYLVNRFHYNFYLESMTWGDIFTNLLIVTIMLILFYLKNYLKAVCLAFRLSGPPALPILGNVLLIKDNKKLEDLGTNMSKLHSPIMRGWLSILPIFLIYEPKHLQMVLSTNKYTTKNILYTFMHNFIGDGLITNSGDQWKQHRKLLQPYFHINILKVYVGAFNKCSNIMVKELRNVTDVNIVEYANKFVLDVLQDAVLGFPIQNDNASPYRKGKAYMPYRLTRPWLLLDTIFKRTDFSKDESEHQQILRDYTKRILEIKKKSFTLNKSPNNLMDMMIEISQNNPEFTDNDIINEACTFMLAGQDSVATALTFTLYYLASHQNVQDKVMEEIRNVIKDDNRPATFDDLSEMKYLEQCIKESMRLSPSVPMFTRKLTEDLPLGKYVLPADTNIIISPFVTHHLPHIFPDPLKFDPDRFSAENKAKIHPYAYIPFSAGPRNCIGYKFALIELKTIISHILRNYHIALVPGHTELNLSYKITLKAKNGIWLRLRKRM